MFKKYSIIILILISQVQIMFGQQDDDKRIPISTFPFVINQSGSYYLIRNLEDSETTNNMYATQINANNVSIDLNGFTLNGRDKGSTGIRINSNVNNIIIRNGTLSNWKQYGIYGAGNQYMIKNVNVINSQNRDIYIRHNSMVSGCNVTSNNQSTGIHTLYSNIINECTVNLQNSQSYGDGIIGGIASIITNNNAMNCDEGIYASMGSYIANNTASKNEEGGRFGSYNIIANNYFTDNNDIGLQVSTASLIFDNHVNNTNTPSSTNVNVKYRGVGISSFSSCMIFNNQLSNNYTGISSGAYENTIYENQTSNNHHIGILATFHKQFFFRNTSTNDGHSPIAGQSYPSGFMHFTTNAAYGPIIDVSSAGNILNVTNSNSRWANLKY